MAQCITIQPEESLIEKCIEKLTFKDEDYSANIVVFPGRRPGHFLRKRISEQIKKPYIPPSVFSIDDLVDSFHDELLQGARKKISQIDAVFLLYEIYRNSDKQIGTDAFMVPELFMPLGIKIYNDLEELYIENIDPERLSLSEESLPILTERNLQSLSYFYKSFYAELNRRGLGSRATGYRETAEALERFALSGVNPMFRNRRLSEYRVIISGFYALSDCERRLFRALSKISDTIYIFVDGKGIKDTITSLDPEFIEKTAQPSKSRQTRIHLYSSSDTHGEVLKTATILKELKDSGINPSTDTLILLPTSDTLFPLLHNCLSEIEDEGFNISMGYPLYRTPVYSFFATLMELVENIYKEGIYVKDYLKFILHPYIKNIYFKQKELSGISKNEITRILVHSIKEFFDERVLNLFINLEEIESAEDIFARFFTHLSAETEIDKKDLSSHLHWIHEKTILSFMNFKDVGDFAEKARELLIFIYKNSTAPEHPYFHPFAEGFIRSFDELKASLFSGYSFSDNAGYFNFFRSYIKNCSVAFEGTPVKGVQVLGPLETRGLRFRRVFALDVNEGIIPDTKRQDTLLPQRVREMLGLSTYKDRERIIDYYFTTLLEGSEQAHIFSIDNNQMQRSRFVERYIWQKQKEDNTTDSDKYINRIIYSLDLSTPHPEPVKKTDAIVNFLREFTYTASSLDDYLSCGLKFYYSNVLGLKNHLITEKINLGLITHTLLHTYFKGYINLTLSEEVLTLKNISDMVNKYFSSRYGSRLDGKTYLIKKQVINRLIELLTGYFIPLAKAHRIIIKNLETVINIRLKDFNLKGIIDRIELRDDVTFIIDYKTSSSNTSLKIDLDKLEINNRDTWFSAVKSVQIPLYIILYTRFANPEAMPRGLYLLLGRTGIDRKKIEYEPVRFDPETYRLMEDYIVNLLEDIINPEIPFQPPEDMKKTCPKCNYQEVCGTKWVKGSDYF